MGVGDYVTLSDDPTHYDLSNCPASMAMAQGEVEERSSKLESEWTAMEFGRTRSDLAIGCRSKLNSFSSNWYLELPVPFGDVFIL